MRTFDLDKAHMNIWREVISRIVWKTRVRADVVLGLGRYRVPVCDFVGIRWQYRMPVFTAGRSDMQLDFQRGPRVSRQNCHLKPHQKQRQGLVTHFRNTIHPLNVSFSLRNFNRKVTMYVHTQLRVIKKVKMYAHTQLRVIKKVKMYVHKQYVL